MCRRHLSIFSAVMCHASCVVSFNHRPVGNNVSVDRYWVMEFKCGFCGPVVGMPMSDASFLYRELSDVIVFIMVIGFILGFVISFISFLFMIELVINIYDLLINVAMTDIIG